ncbi:hypothetical protein KC19_9G050000 [Ceratodon purpureus]|uniref:Uncharacterized protein n=1 Tax=Ceratodon purpureus TaxID=3225 RepID=A0A8T0GS59_CERPU|nr:hypothetical protein KC19_9G050000 [Ceratodon purpureus]
MSNRESRSERGMKLGSQGRAKRTVRVPLPPMRTKTLVTKRLWIRALVHRESHNLNGMRAAGEKSRTATTVWRITRSHRRKKMEQVRLMQQQVTTQTDACL